MSEKTSEMPWADVRKKIEKWEEDQDSDDYFSPVSSHAVKTAYVIIDLLESKGHKGPTDVVRDPSGGITISSTSGDMENTITIWDDGTAEAMTFVGHRLISRQWLAHAPLDRRC